MAKKKSRKKKKKQADMPLRNKIIGSVVVAIVFLLLLRACFGGGSTKEQKAAIDPSAPMTEQLEIVFEESEIRGEDLKIYPSDAGYGVQFKHDFAFWDETDFVGRAIGSYVKFCEIAYRETDVSGIEFIIFGGMTDARGNTTDQKQFTMYMPKEKFLSYNWENIVSLDGTYSQIESDCDNLFIHVGIRSKVDFNKVHVTE